MVVQLQKDRFHDMDFWKMKGNTSNMLHRPNVQQHVKQFEMCSCFVL